jgi:hypothetical protein
VGSGEAGHCNHKGGNMGKKKQFPKVIYISIFEDEEDAYLAWDNFEDSEDNIPVAIYELREVKKHCIEHSLE